MSVTDMSVLNYDFIYHMCEPQVNGLEAKEINLCMWSVVIKCRLGEETLESTATPLGYYSQTLVCLFFGDFSVF